jgi:hypothetical protein
MIAEIPKRRKNVADKCLEIEQRLISLVDKTTLLKSSIDMLEQESELFLSVESMRSNVKAEFEVAFDVIHRDKFAIDVHSKLLAITEEAQQAQLTSEFEYMHMTLQELVRQYEVLGMVVECAEKCDNIKTLHKRVQSADSSTRNKKAKKLVEAQTALPDLFKKTESIKDALIAIRMSVVNTISVEETPDNLSALVAAATTRVQERLFRWNSIRTMKTQQPSGFLTQDHDQHFLSTWSSPTRSSTSSTMAVDQSMNMSNSPFSTPSLGVPNLMDSFKTDCTDFNTAFSWTNQLLPLESTSLSNFDLSSLGSSLFPVGNTSDREQPASLLSSTSSPAIQSAVSEVSGATVLSSEITNLSTVTISEYDSLMERLQVVLPLEQKTKLWYSCLNCKKKMTAEEYRRHCKIVLFRAHKIQLLCPCCNENFDDLKYCPRCHFGESAEGIPFGPIGCFGCLEVIHDCSNQHAFEASILGEFPPKS